MSEDEIDEAIRQFKFKAYNCNIASAEIDPSVLSTDEPVNLRTRLTYQGLKKNMPSYPMS